MIACSLSFYFYYFILCSCCLLYTSIEIVFLPLLEKNGTKRVLGLFQPIAANVSISRPALRFSLTALLPPDPQMPTRPELKVVATN